MYKNSIRYCATFVLLAFCLLLQKEVFAHAKDQSYLYVRVYQSLIEGTVETTYKDLNTALGLDLKDEMGLSELQPYLARIQQYILDGVSISSTQGKHQIRFVEPRLMPSMMGTFLKSDFVLENVDTIPDALEVSYNLIFEQDPAHTAFLVVRHNWKAGIVDNEGLPSATFTRNNTTNTLSLTEKSIMKGVWKMAKLGMRHILIGLDHIFFLIALLLPLVMRRSTATDSPNTWEPLDSVGPALRSLFQVVLAFTVGYSLTLHLGARGIVPFTPRIAESMIALSIGLAAFHILKPVFGRIEWIIALVFGLFHGLGFASMLGEKGLRGEFLVPSLSGFNIGIEFGQILLVAILFPIFYYFRKTSPYQKVLYYGSILLIVIALYWFVERFFEVDFIIDNFIGKVFRKVASLFHHH